MTNDKGKWDYAIGYKKPPEHTRFRKGVSGNPAGRPRGQASLQHAVCQLLNQPIGKHKGIDISTLKGRDAVALSVIRSTLRGSAKHAALVFQIERQHTESLDNQQPDPVAEHRIAENALGRLGRRRRKK